MFDHMYSSLAVLVLFSPSVFILVSALFPQRMKRYPSGFPFSWLFDTLDHLPTHWGRVKYFLGLGPRYIMPDIVSYCKYPVLCNPHYDEQSKASLKWLNDICNFSEERFEYYAKVGLGKLCRSVYPNADATRLRIAEDWMNYIFVLDDWLDELDVDGNRGIEEHCMAAMRQPFDFKSNVTAAIMTQSWCARLEEHSSVACRERMTETMLGFFRSLREQAAHRVTGYIPDLEEYMALRRDTIGAFPALVLIEFCGGYHLPDHIYKHPIIQSLQLATIDHICWVNDLASYNVEQARGDTHNLITIGMRTKGWSLQEAVDFAGRSCNACIDRFEQARKQVPSFDSETDKVIAQYITSMQNWISGHLYWSFATERYLGNEGLAIMKHRVVKLYPR